MKKQNKISPLHNLFESIRKKLLTAFELQMLVADDFQIHCDMGNIEAIKVSDSLMKEGWISRDFKRTEKAEVLIKELEGLFKPLKKNAIEIPEDMVIAYNDMFPQIKIPTSGKYARCNVKELTKSFDWFIQTYNHSWDTILKATARYVYHKEQDNWNYMRTSRYFVRKQDANKVWTSDLADYCDQVIANPEENNSSNHFTEKVV